MQLITTKFPYLLLVGAMGFAFGCTQPEVKKDPNPSADESQSPPHFFLKSDGALAVTDVTSEMLEQDGRPVFSVFTKEAFQADLKAPVLGSYHRDGTEIYFQPRFSFEPGMTYIAQLDPDLLTGPVESFGGTEKSGETLFEFTMPESMSAGTFVERIYPRADRLPENLLKFYVYFSAPMNPAKIHRHIRLMNSDKQEILLAFVEIENGLWDAAQKRLTLFLHPGRIKRDVGPNLKMGPPLQKGETYRLIVDRNWKDVYGNHLQDTFTKTFTVSEADRTVPDYADWQIGFPQSSVRQPVIVSFPEPLDHALLRRYITVANARGIPVPGKVDISDGETRWLFAPDRDWQPGNYRLRVDTRLEDLAGNRLSGLLEQNEGEPGTGTSQDFIEVPFNIIDHETGT